MVKFLATLAAALMGVASASPAPHPSAAEEGSSPAIEKRGTSFYYPNMDHSGSARGFAPDLDGDFAYPVYKTVNPGDGNALQDAINSATNGQRHNMWLASQPRVVYIPPGTYTISKTLYMKVDTILMGDPTNPPIIKAAGNFWNNDRTLVSGQDPATNGVGEISFAVGLKNLILDTTAIPGDQQFTALNWGVAQVAQLQNMKIVMGQSNTVQGHTGIRLGRGSTLGLADVRIEMGQNGIMHDGHQQALYKSIYFFKNTVGMLITGGSTISIVNPTFDQCGTGVLNTGGNPYIGLVDAISKNSGVTFVTKVFPSILIDNLVKDTNSNVFEAPAGVIIGPASHIDTFTYGNTVGRNPVYGPVSTFTGRPQAVAPGGRFPYVAAPTYADKNVNDFINVKDPKTNGGRQVFGDNSRDEADTLNAILKMAAQQNKIVYFPFGKYRVDKTLFVPINSRIVGEGWATITGNGQFFMDGNSPKPVVAVGNFGDVGVAQIQDIRVTVSDVLPGAILMQFNAAGNKPGDVALWNSMITVGGTRGAPALTNACRDAKNPCKAAFLGIHLTPSSSAYIENVWNWVADHITEEFDGGSSISGKGGVLVEATKGTWLHALGSEHWWLYQLNLRNSQNVFVSLLQSETNYEQGDNAASVVPAPWVADVKNWGDPDFSWCKGEDTRCRMGFANYINGGSDIYTYASASWTFFKGPGFQTCSGFQCQNYIHWIAQKPNNLQAYGLCSKDSWSTLHLADGSNIVSQPDFLGSWPGGGGLIVRYNS